jgi:hypothetical protein
MLAINRLLLRLKAVNFGADRDNSAVPAPRYAPDRAVLTAYRYRGEELKSTATAKSTSELGFLGFWDDRIKSQNQSQNPTSTATMIIYFFFCEKANSYSASGYYI